MGIGDEASRTLPADLALLTADPPLSYRDLGEALDMPIGSIGPTRARCLEHLRKIASSAGISVEEFVS